jgi:hypothetical protein
VRASTTARPTRNVVALPNHITFLKIFFVISFGPFCGGDASQPLLSLYTQTLTPAGDMRIGQRTVLVLGL